MKKKLSIITVCFNERNTIIKTIDSVLSQTFKDFEWIIIDGGSIDGTKEILDEYKSFFTHYLSEADRGIYHAMNKGLSLAKGEYILFLNGGDYLFNDQVLGKICERNLKADIIHGIVKYIENGINKYLKDPDPITKEYLTKATIKHPASFVRRNVFEKIGGFDESFKIAGDYDFFLRAVFKGNATTQFLEEIITVYNLNGISNTNYKLVEKERKVARARNINSIDYIFIGVNRSLKRAKKIFKNIILQFFLKK